MQIGPASSKFAIVASLVLTAAIGAAVAPSAHAQDRLAGKYYCVRVEVGHISEKCQSPELVLHRDGTYEIWGEHGTYSVVQGRWLVLSHSKRRGLGHFEDLREIVFEYKMDGKVCRVTFRRVFEAPPGFHWG